MPTDKIPSASLNTEWGQTIEERIAPIVGEAAEWWHALGEYKGLQDDVTFIQDLLTEAGSLPLNEQAHMLATSMGLLALNGPYPDMARRKAVETLLSKYPRLTYYSPQIEQEHLTRALELTICTDWNCGEQELRREVSRSEVRRLIAAHAEIWRVHWETIGGTVPFSNDVHVPLERMQPILDERVWHDPVHIPDHTEGLAVVFRISLDSTYEEDYARFTLARKEARRLLVEEGRQERQRRKPGDDKTYFTMVNLYQDWCARGRPAQLGRGLGGKKYTKVLLAQAIEWLDPDKVGDITLEQ